MAVEPTHARAQLLREHERLRALLSAAQAIADRLRSGERVGGELATALLDLRNAFAEHNAGEEALLRPILSHDRAWGAPRIQRMLEEHAAEHDVLHALLSGADDDIVEQLAEFAEEVCAHMDAEERTFLHPHVLDDDLLDGRGTD